MAIRLLLKLPPFAGRGPRNAGILERMAHKAHDGARAAHRSPRRDRRRQHTADRPDRIMEIPCSSIERPAGRFRHTRGKVVCIDSAIKHCHEPPFQSCHRRICYMPWHSQNKRQYIGSSPDSWIYLPACGAPPLMGGSRLLNCPLTFTLTRVGGVSSAEPAETRLETKPHHFPLVSRL
jgi:hypothetical protein